MDRDQSARWDFGKVKIGQLKEGVDMFYSDFRNKAIDRIRTRVYARPPQEKIFR
jgi:hypothetical protein